MKLGERSCEALAFRLMEFAYDYRDYFNVDRRNGQQIHLIKIGNQMLCTSEARK